MLSKIYSIIRGMTPKRWHSFFTSMLYDLGIKPTVNRKLKSPFPKGIIVISADFEMAWAFRYSKTKGNEAVYLGLHERKNMPKLLNLFNKNNIPITWATVGHLFLDSCNRDNGLAHVEMPRPKHFENKNWKFNDGDWYQHDPCNNYKESAAWYAPDLIELILSSPLKHEIGCHTFSHIDCTDENCTPELLYSELNTCIEIAKKKGINLKSLVFPGGTHGNYYILKELGFLCYRVKTDFHIDTPKIDNFGLVRIPSSYSLDKTNSSWSSKRYQRIAKSFIDKAAKHKMVAHLWFHPSMDEWYLENVMPFITSYLEEQVDKGRIEIQTMNQLAERVLYKTRE